MILTNVQPSPIDSRDYKYPTATPATTSSLPFSVDLREYSGDIEQQGQTGSCVANAAVSALEILLTRQGQFENLSRLFHYWNLRQGYPDLAGVDSGSYPRDAFKIANQIGICDETVWPFDESKVNAQPTQSAFDDASAIKAFGYYSITMGWTQSHKATALLTIKQAVSRGYPVLIAAQINEEFQQIYSNTIEGTQSQFVNAQISIGAHAVLVVGYAGNSLLIENSWGTSWGCNGYALIPGPALMEDTFEAWVCTGINGNQLPNLATAMPLGDPPQWWEIAPNLTPIAAWDAARVNGAQLLDGVGDNHITATSELTNSDFPFAGVAGNSNPMALTTPVPIPSVGVVAGFWSPNSNPNAVVLLSHEIGSSTGYMLHISTDRNWYSTNPSGHGVYGLYGDIGTRYFAAIVTRGSDSILYVNGNLVGDPVSSSSIMSQIAQVGYGENGNLHNFDSNEFLHAIGVWSGAATQNDIKAIEAAARLALKGPNVTQRGFVNSLGRMAFPIPQHLLLTPSPPRFVGSTLTRRDYQFGGSGRIAGTVKEKGATDQPLQRRVQLYDETSKIMTREVWSDPVTGAYLFENIDPLLTYTIISYDYKGTYRAVIANGIKSTV
jgi:hypothetical protein